MPRPPRLSIAHLPLHIVQRGNNRQPCFLDDDDRRFYLHTVHELLSRHDVALHAYVLMSNHVHLLATPGAVGAASRFMQSLGRRYVGFFNWRHARSGTLWEGRFKSCLVESDSYLLRCYRYIELNPVRASLVSTPSQFPWSSHAHNASGFPDRLIRPHPLYLALDADPQARRAAYRAFVAEGIESSELSEIRAYIGQERALGSASFQRKVAAATGRAATIKPRGRPARLPNGHKARSRFANAPDA